MTNPPIVQARLPLGTASLCAQGWHFGGLWHCYAIVQLVYTPVPAPFRLCRGHLCPALPAVTVMGGPRHDGSWLPPGMCLKQEGRGTRPRACSVRGTTDEEHKPRGPTAWRSLQGEAGAGGIC